MTGRSLLARTWRDLAPDWIAPVLAGCAVVLLPWTALLFSTLPRQYVAEHWAIAWCGFDVGLGVALVSTAITVVRRSPFAELAAAVTGALLCCDAWFDVLTARGHGALALAVVCALLVELPLAALCFRIAGGLARAFGVRAGERGVAR